MVPQGTRIAVVGATAALAEEVVGALHDSGARLALTGCDSARLDAVRQRAPEARTWVLDVTDAAAVARVVTQTARALGGLDALVYFPGVQVRGPAVEVTPSQWRGLFAVNVEGAFYCAQAAGRIMIAQGRGKLVFITSLTAEIGLPYAVPYSASKGALRQMARALAAEWAPLGVTVNCVGPGRFRTPMTEDLFSDPDRAAAFVRCIPAGRPGRPGDLAGIVRFLCSPASDYVTGQSFYVDGGWLACGGCPTG